MQQVDSTHAYGACLACWVCKVIARHDDETERERERDHHFSSRLEPV